jgi:hypothetical protein
VRAGAVRTCVMWLRMYQPAQNKRPLLLLTAAPLHPRHRRSRRTRRETVTRYGHVRAAAPCQHSAERALACAALQTVLSHAPERCRRPPTPVLAPNAHARHVSWLSAFWLGEQRQKGPGPPCFVLCTFPRPPCARWLCAGRFCTLLKRRRRTSWALRYPRGASYTEVQLLGSASPLRASFTGAAYSLLHSTGPLHYDELSCDSPNGAGSCR